ncbi:MAG TPA: hypothetical protein VGR38_05010 [Candidatus Polarisedimenticolia bacterium]|nr:hypothetical protein [Candidatus Polarisedimenticolia bacterium]
MSALVLGLLLLAAAPVPQGRGLTVGEFAVLVASNLAPNESQKTPFTPDLAVARLQSAGLKIRNDVSSPATEGDAVQIFRQLGISIETRDSAALLDRDRATSLIGVFRNSLSSRPGTASSTTPSATTNTAAASPSADSAALLESIADCQALAKTPDCQACCRALFPQGQNEFHSNRVCAKACNTKARNVSPAEPTP